MCSVMLGMGIVWTWTGVTLGWVWYMDQAQRLVCIIAINIDAVTDVPEGGVPVAVERAREEELARGAHDTKHMTCEAAVGVYASACCHV